METLYRFVLRTFKYPLLLLSRNFVRRKNLKWKTHYKIPHSNHNIILSGLPTENYLNNNTDNIDYIINMTDEFSYGNLVTRFKYSNDKFVYLYKYNKIPIYQIPVVDYYQPDFDQIMYAVKLINMIIKNNKNKTILIHCKSGIGRSATVLMCWFYYHHHLTINDPKSIDDIHTELKLQRPQIKDSIKEYQSVHQYVDYINVSLRSDFV